MSNANHLRQISLEERRIIEGPDDKLMQISPCKYPEPMAIMEKSMRDDWKHWHVTLVDDLRDFRALPKKTQIAIQKDLGFLSNLDGIQLNTLANSIGRYITAPEYRMALVRQTYEEEVHVLTYDRMINTLEMDPIETYNLFMTDELLRALCFTEEMFTLIGWQTNGGLTYLGLKVIQSRDVTELEVK